MGSTSHLVLIRHAHTEGNDFSNGSARLCGQCDLPLSEAGTRQVERLRARLAAEPARALYSSPLERARGTAVAAAPHLAERMRILKSLAEIDCGELDGMLLREVQARYPALWQRNLSQAEEDFQWPGGESYRRLRRRALRVIRLIAERHKGERVLLVTHAGFISSLLGFLAGANPAEWSKFRPGNASITEVVWNGHGGDLITFDDRSHLNSNRH